MAYNEKLAEKVRDALSGVRNIQEKKMFGGIAFMVNDILFQYLNVRKASRRVFEATHN